MLIFVREAAISYCRRRSLLIAVKLGPPLSVKSVFSMKLLNPGNMVVADHGPRPFLFPGARKGAAYASHKPWIILE
jgi:hypothetical protein